MSKPTLPQKLKAARLARGLSEQDFAQRMRMPVFDVQDIESGDKPVTLDFVRKLGKNFELTKQQRHSLLSDLTEQSNYCVTTSGIQSGKRTLRYVFLLISYIADSPQGEQLMPIIIDFLESL